MEDLGAGDLDFDQVSPLFDEIAKPWVSVEESFDVDRDKLQEQMKIVDRLEKAIIRESLFSENEDFDEIDVEHLKYLLLPYVIGKMAFNSNQNRLKQLDTAKQLFLSYLNLCDHYGVLPLQIKALMASISQETFKPQREVKIALYKAGKAAEGEAETLEHQLLQGFGDKRKVVKALMVFKCFQAVSDIEMIPQEQEMLKFKQKLDANSDFRREYEAELARPRPKPFFKKINQEDVKKLEATGAQINSQDIRGLATHAEHHPHCPNSKTKLDVMDKLWQPDFAQPNMTMDEHADLEYRLMVEKAESGKQHQEREQAHLDRLTEDEKEELERLKTSKWDDWKDAHEKGAGNKKR